MQIKSVSISEIQPNPKQPRKDFGDLTELKNSLKVKGLLQPIIINNNNVIIAGERRFKACCELGWEEIDTITINAENLDAMEISLIENWHRKNLTSMERENMIYLLWVSNKYLSKKNLAERLGISENAIIENINAKEFRETGNKSSAAELSNISTRTIYDTVGLAIEERQDIIEKVSKGEIAPQKVREEVKIRKLKKELDEKHPIRPKDKTIVGLILDAKKQFQYAMGISQKILQLIPILNETQKSELKPITIETIGELTNLQKHL